jgi:hypothetical protein
MFARIILIILFQICVSTSLAETNNSDRIKLISAVNSVIDSALKIAAQRMGESDLANQPALREDIEAIINSANSVDELELIAVVSFHLTRATLEVKTRTRSFDSYTTPVFGKSYELAAQMDCVRLIPYDGAYMRMALIR